jgi:hypothetical protein
MTWYIEVWAGATARVAVNPGIPLGQENIIAPDAESCTWVPGQTVFGIAVSNTVGFGFTVTRKVFDRTQPWFSAVIV